MKKLKKVDENATIQKKQTELNTRLEALNNAYKIKDGLLIDEASKRAIQFIESIGLKGSEYHASIKNYTWQRNHLRVLASISTLMQQNNRMPTTQEIACDAGLSTETVYKHLREFKDHELYQHEWDKYRLMIHRVLSTVFNAGVQGDIRACKVYLDYFTNNSNTPVPPTFEQTNYIQINNLKITPDELRQLPPATLQKIESIIKRPVKKTK